MNLVGLLDIVPSSRRDLLHRLHALGITTLPVLTHCSYRYFRQLGWEPYDIRCLEKYLETKGLRLALPDPAKSLRFTLAEISVSIYFQEMYRKAGYVFVWQVLKAGEERVRKEVTKMAFSKLLFQMERDGLSFGMAFPEGDFPWNAPP